MSYNITGTTITLTRGDTFEALVSATKRDGTQYIPVAGGCPETPCLHDCDCPQQRR